MSETARLSVKFLDLALQKRRAERETVVEAFQETERKILDELAGRPLEDVDNHKKQDEELVLMLRLLRNLSKGLDYISQQEQVDVMNQRGKTEEEQSDVV